MVSKADVYNCFLLIIIVSVIIKEGQGAKDKGNCELIDSNGRKLSEKEWSSVFKMDPVYDYQEHFTELLRLRTENIPNNIEEKDYSVSQTEHYQRFIFPSNDWTINNFVIKLDNEFDKYEEYETAQELKLKVNFKCQNEEYSTMEFSLFIKDTNNHDPTFLNGPYEYKLPMPLPKGYELDFSKKIMVQDVDLTNSEILLNLDSKDIDPRLFAITTIGQDPQNRKKYLTKFITSTIVDLDENVNLTLFATDSVDVKRTVATNVTLIVDKANSFPRFSHPLYTADLKSFNCTKMDKILLPFVENNVTLVRGYNGIEKFEIRNISKENEEHFKLIHVNETDNGIVTYVEMNNLSEDFLKQKVVTVVLAAIGDGVKASTFLQILMPEVAISDSQVKNSTYTNSISGSANEASSTNGYMVATIVLFIVLVTLLGYTIYSILV